MEAADGKAKFGMVKQINILKKRLLVKEEEQALHFKEGCALAKELNNRKVLAEQLRWHKARGGDKIAGMVELTYAAVQQQRRAYKASTKFVRFTATEKALAVKWRNNGMSVGKCAELLGRSSHSISVRTRHNSRIVNKKAMKKCIGRPALFSEAK